MIHVLITSDTVIRDLFVNDYQFLAHSTEPDVYQSKNTWLIYRKDLKPAIIDEAIQHFLAEKIWIISLSNLISTDHKIGDIIMPNVFLTYDHEIDTIDFDGTNRDNFLHDPLFLHHYETQSDLDFETFGLSIGGICVTKNDGVDDVDREQIEFAYSADSIDESCYFLIEAAQKLGRSEDIYPILAIGDTHTSVEEKAKIMKNIPPVLVYLQSQISDDVSDLTGVTDVDDDFIDEPDEFDEEEMKGFHQVRD